MELSIPILPILRIVAKLNTCYSELDDVSEKISEANSAGIVDGFSPESGSQSLQNTGQPILVSNFEPAIQISIIVLKICGVRKEAEIKILAERGRTARQPWLCFLVKNCQCPNIDYIFLTP